MPRLGGSCSIFFLPYNHFTSLGEFQLGLITHGFDIYIRNNGVPPPDFLLDLTEVIPYFWD